MDYNKIYNVSLFDLRSSDILPDTEHVEEALSWFHHFHNL